MTRKHKKKFPGARVAKLACAANYRSNIGSGLSYIFCTFAIKNLCTCSDFIWPFLAPYRGTILNQKMAYIFPILCILGIIFLKSLRNFLKCKGKGSFPKSKIKSLTCLFIQLKIVCTENLRNGRAWLEKWQTMVRLIPLKQADQS